MITTNQSPAGITFISNFGDLGGNNFTAAHLSKFYNYDQPYNFGKMVARKWASLSPLFYPKVLTNLTIGSGRTYEIDTATFQWSIGQDVDRHFRFMEDPATLNPNAQNNMLGYGNTRFDVVLDVDWARTNSVLTLEDNRYKLVVTKDPVPYGAFFKYEVEIQGSNPNVFVPALLVGKGKMCSETASRAAEYGNQNLPGVHMGTASSYQNVIGIYGRQASIDERLIKKEIQARKMGTIQGASTNQSRFVDAADWASGLAFKPLSKNTKTGEISEIPHTGFISWMEAKIEETVMMDREYMMVYGEFEAKQNGNLGIIDTRMAPGMRALCHDGHTVYHSGDWQASDFQSYFMGIFLGRVDFSSRAIEVTTGELGMIMFDKMLAIQYRGWQGANDSILDAQFFVREKGEAGDLEFGSQFKSFRAYNGIKVTLRHDRKLDDPYYSLKRYPFDANFTVDSARFDIYDFGMTNSSKNYIGSNVCMITQIDTDQVYWKIGRMHPFQGYLSNFVTSEDTNCTYKRTINGSLQVWDTSRIGAIIYDPDYTA